MTKGHGQRIFTLPGKTKNQNKGIVYLGIKRLNKQEISASNIV